MTFGNPILGGDGELVRAAMRSPNYDPGVAGWEIRQDGTAEFREVTAAGFLELADGQVTTAKLADGAVSTAKIGDAVVSLAKLADGSVDAAKLVAGAVGAAALQADAVVAGKIAAGVVGATELAANSVVAGKIAAGAIDAMTINGNTITGATISGSTVTANAGDVELSAAVGVKVSDPNGSYVQLYDDAFLGQAVVYVRPQDAPGHTVHPGKLVGDVASTLGEYPAVYLDSPTLDAYSGSSLVLVGQDHVHTAYAQINAPDTYVSGNLTATGIITSAPLGLAVLSPTLGDPGTASGSYTDVPGATSVTLTKAADATRLLVQFAAEFYCTGANNNGVLFGLNIDGTDYDAAAGFAAPQLTHFTATGFTVISGIAAGTYTVQARWQQTSGAGTVLRDAVSSISFCVQELS